MLRLASDESTLPRIGARRRRQGRRSESKTLDDSKQTANWGRPVKSIHEEVGAGGQHVSGELEQTADHIINSCPLHRPPSEAGLFEVGPLTRAWLQQNELIIYERRSDEIPTCLSATAFMTASQVAVRE